MSKYELISERSLNRVVKPMINSKGFKKEFPVEYDGNLITNFWSEKCFNLMDFFASYMWFKYKEKNEVFFNVKTPYLLIQKNKQFKCLNPNTIIDLENSFNLNNINNTLRLKDVKIQISAREMKRYPQIKKLRLFELEDVIKRTSECGHIINYEVRSFDLATNKFYKFNYKNQNIDSFFKYKIIDVKYSTNNNIIDTIYEFSFDTFLGNLFLYNIYNMNFDYIKKDFYTISRYAQILYRKFMLTHKRNKMHFLTNTASERLSLTNNTNLLELQKTIIKIMDELYIKKYIFKYKYEKSKINEYSSLNNHNYLFKYSKYETKNKYNNLIKLNEDLNSLCINEGQN